MFQLIRFTQFKCYLNGCRNGTNDHKNRKWTIGYGVFYYDQKKDLNSKFV